MKRENNLQIDHFLEQNKDAESVAPAVDWGTALETGRQIFPGEADMDGFFYALLRKKN